MSLILVNVPGRSLVKTKLNKHRPDRRRDWLLLLGIVDLGAAFVEHEQSHSQGQPGSLAGRRYRRSKENEDADH